MSPPAFDGIADTSAVLCVLREEPGFDLVRKRIMTTAVSVVNLAEIVTKLTEWGVPPALVDRVIERLNLRVVPFDQELAVQAGLLHHLTKGRNISLGDRACLVTAKRFGVPAVTGDREWALLGVDISVELIR